MAVTSNAWGEAAEALAETSFRYYQARDLMCWTKTYPQTKVWNEHGRRQWGGWDGLSAPEKKVALTGIGPPDYCLALKGYGGRLMWIEVKEWEEKVTGKNAGHYTLSRRIHQYLTMKDFASVGALCAYLVAWRQPDNSFEWRLHPVRWLTRNEKGHILFVKSEGIQIDERDGWPDWLPRLVSQEAVINR